MRVPASSSSSVAILLLASLAFLLASDRARAAIHACAPTDGGTLFQDRPCDERPSSRRAVDTGRDTGGTRAANAPVERPPAGLHPSWFERPVGADEPVRCDDAGCRCGSIRRSFDGGLAVAVADALYLDGAWHRYATRVASGPSGTAAERPGAAVSEAACDVTISQDILATHAESVLGALRRMVREAEEYGFDDPLVCERGNLRACDHLDAIALYRRMIPDLGALRAPRDAASGAADGPSDNPSGKRASDHPFDATGRRFGTFPNE